MLKERNRHVSVSFPSKIYILRFCGLAVHLAATSLESATEGTNRTKPPRLFCAPLCLLWLSATAIQISFVLFVLLPGKTVFFLRVSWLQFESGTQELRFGGLSS